MTLDNSLLSWFQSFVEGLGHDTCHTLNEKNLKLFYIRIVKLLKYITTKVRDSGIVSTGILELASSVSNILFQYWKSETEFSRLLPFNLLSSMIELHLVISATNSTVISGLDNCLLGIYNMSIVGEGGKPRVDSMTVPDISKSSVYHRMYRQMRCNSYLSFQGQSSYGPCKSLKKIYPENRLDVMAQLLRVVNEDIVSLTMIGLMDYCEVITRVVSSGLPIHLVLGKEGSDTNGEVKIYPAVRILVSDSLLIEASMAAHFCLFNGVEVLGQKALDVLSYRAEYEISAQALLVTNAIRNIYNSSKDSDGSLITFSQRNVTENTNRTAVSDDKQTVEEPRFDNRGRRLSRAGTGDVLRAGSFRASKLAEDIEPASELHSTKGTALETKL